jgi:hypothetical protein
MSLEDKAQLAALLQQLQVELARADATVLNPAVLAALEKLLILARGSQVVASGDSIAQDKVTGDKVFGDKISTYLSVLSRDVVAWVGRSDAYKQLFAILMTYLPRYDQPVPSDLEQLKQLTTAMRDWYTSNGIYLAEECRQPYFDLKDELKATINLAEAEPATAARAVDAEQLIELASALRRCLAENLGLR